jgi:hypothetical protein
MSTNFRERKEGEGAREAADIVRAAASRGVSGADLFISFAAMIARQNPNLARRTLSALGLTVASREVVVPADGVVVLNTTRKSFEVVDMPLTPTERPAPQIVTTIVDAEAAPFGDDVCQCGECR